MHKTSFLLLILCMLVACKNSKKEEKEPIKLGSYSDKQTETKQDPLTASKERGGLIYTDFCMQCHIANGKGVPGAFPPLAGSNWLKDKREASIHAVKYGQKGEIEVNGKTYNGVMVPMGLSDQEVADVMNYIMNSWGNTQDTMVTKEEVASIEKKNEQ